MIAFLTGQGFDVQTACLMLSVAPSGYYDWKVRPPSARTLRHAWLAGEIAQVHKDSGGTYGTLRITAELRYGRGIHVGKEQVHRLMRRLGIYGLPKRRLPRGARIGKPNSLDLVRRRFKADGPDRLWMTDITEHPTREGKIYCCAVIDAFSRMVVGWSIDSRQTGLLVTNALGMALNRRAPGEGGIIHSDQGVQFASWVFSQKVTEAGLAPSVGAVGAPRWSRRSGPACRSSCSTAEDGRQGSSSPPRSTTTSRSGTTPAGATAPYRCSHQQSSRTNTNNNTPPPDSRLPTPRNPGQITFSVEPRTAHSA